MENKKNFLLVVLAMLITATLLLSNISASNTFYVNEFISLSAAEFLFPVTYILNDLLVEFFGAKKTTKVVGIGLGLTIFGTVFLFLSTLIPSNYVEYNTVFGNLTSGIVGITIASIIAFLLGTVVNAFIMEKMKKRDTTGKSGKFFARAITSSLVAELTDSLVFITLCCLLAPEFYAWDRLISFVLTITTIKLTVEIILFPVLNFIRQKLKHIQLPPTEK